MYFETGQGSALSANAHHGIDQQTCEARAYAVARAFEPLLVNSVVGFIGPEYLYDGKEILRAALEDHFCGKLMGLPMGVDVCYTNHAEADQNDMDTILTMLAAAGVTYVMGVPGADDVMLNYQSTSFHDALFVREAFGLKRAPEFEAWLAQMRITDAAGRLAARAAGSSADRRCVAEASAHERVRRAIRGSFLPSARRRGSPAAEPVHRCRRGRCSRSTLRTRWRAMPCMPASIVRSLGRRSALEPDERGGRERGRRTADLSCASPMPARRLDAASAARLSEFATGPCDLAVIIGDGLSAAAVEAHAATLVAAFVPLASGSP